MHDTLEDRHTLCNTRADTNEMTGLNASFCGAQAINMEPESCQSTP